MKKDKISSELQIEKAIRLKKRIKSEQNSEQSSTNLTNQDKKNQKRQKKESKLNLTELHITKPNLTYSVS